jgi:hypothetical protein
MDELTEIEQETCEVCGDRVSVCDCWRCFTCFELFSADEEALEDDDDESICAQCLAAQ